MPKAFTKPILNSTLHQIKKEKLPEKHCLVFMDYNELVQNIKDVKIVYVCNTKSYSFVTVPLMCYCHGIDVYELENCKNSDGFFVEMR